MALKTVCNGLVLPDGEKPMTEQRKSKCSSSKQSHLDLSEPANDAQSRQLNFISRATKPEPDPKEVVVRLIDQFGSIVNRLLKLPVITDMVVALQNTEVS